MKALSRILLYSMILLSIGCSSIQYKHKEFDRKGVIYSLEIEPSRSDSGWILYSKGAVVTLKAKNIRKAVILYFPTGTGVGELFPNGARLGRMIQSSEDDDIWTYSLKESLMTTNFWVEATDLRGDILKSSDLGNVGDDEVGKDGNVILF